LRFSLRGKPENRRTELSTRAHYSAAALSDPRLIGVLSGHTEPIHGIAFSSDSHTVATASDDPVVETDAERVAARIRHTAQPGPDQTEWQRHLPDLPFRDLCR
jgi:hypothetical protein